MAVEEVACPHCGHVTMATVPREADIARVRKQGKLHGSSNEATCSECGISFVVYFNWR